MGIEMWDFRTARDGSFIKKEPGSMSGHINIYWVPTNSIRQEFIANIPEEALVYMEPGLHSKMPKKGKYILLSGATIEDSIVLKKLDTLKTDYIIGLTSARIKAETVMAAKAITDAQTSKSSSAIVEEDVRRLKKLRDIQRQDVPINLRDREDFGV